MQRYWETVIRPLLQSIDAKRIVEIGVGDGGNTKNILSYIEPLQGRLDAIDCCPTCDIENWQSPALHFHKELSLNILGTLPAYDAILIDGDHNWYTVYHELLLIEQAMQKKDDFPLIFLHDVGWPYARRDLYYDPETIPMAFRQPYQRKGLNPDIHGLCDTATFNNQLRHSVYEHAIKNGVLTAVEDFLAQTPVPLRFVRIPGWHGLGILAPKKMIGHFPKLGNLLKQCTASKMLERHIEELERGRIECMEETNQKRKHTEAVLEEEYARLRHDKRVHNDEKVRIQNENELLQERERALLALQIEAEKQIHETEEIRHALQCDAILIKEKNDQLDADAKKWVLEKNEIQALRSELEHLIHTRSWRYTAWIRKMEAALRKPRSQSSGAFPTVKRLWIMLGMPFPDLARHVRYDILGRLYPVRDAKSVPSPALSMYPATTAIVIPCHNYAHFLSDALESALAQTQPPQEIIVVDDASTDDTYAVAERYKDQGVRYIRGDWKSVGAARNAGLRETTANFLIFLDADDLLHPTYIRASIEALAGQPTAGISYSNQQYFGESTMRYDAPRTFDWKRFDAVNHFNSAAMVRRTALLQAGGFSHGVDQDGDWVTWRRILHLGWKAVKAETVFYYRVHGKNMTTAMTEREIDYPDRAGFLEEPATLCLSLSGRSWAWAGTADFLEKQTFPHHLIHLIILDTSQDHTFTALVRGWLQHCDYGGITFLQESVGRKGLADLPRVNNAEDEVREACANIYNRFARLITTTMVFFLEDDILPPNDAFVRLASHFTRDTVSVSGSYLHRHSQNPVAWEWKMPDAPPEYATMSKGVTAVGGNGFGCLAVRGEYVRRTVFQASQPFRHYDYNFYHQAVCIEGKTALLDWECTCEHRSAPVV
jgi:glycosyltransferase involved in cell wall biosynthesis